MQKSQKLLSSKWKTPLFRFVLLGAGLWAATGLSERPLQAQVQNNLPKIANITSVKHKRALLVGISKYEHGGPLDWPNLSCANDIATMRQILISKFGFAPQDILTLTDAQATRAGIIEAFRRQLIEPAEPGDVMLFHFSGHGQPVADDNGDELDGLDETLVPSDYISQSARDGAKTNLRDDQLGELLGELRQKMRGAEGQVQGNITVFIDSCHSGTATRGQTPNGRLRVRGRGWNTAIDGPKPLPHMRGAMSMMTDNMPPTPADQKGASGIFPAGVAKAQGDIVISACDSDQLAQETENEQGKDMGAFTYYLTRALARATPGETYRDLFEKMNAEMMGSISDQNPQLEGDLDKALFSGTALPTPDYLVVSEATAEGVSLPVGSVQGMTKGSRFALYKAGSDVTQEANLLAVAEVSSLDATSCRVTLLPTYSTMMKADDLKGARAVEIARNYSANPLKVWVDAPANGDNQGLLDALAKIPVVSTEAVGQTNFDIHISPEGQNWVLERKDGSALARLPQQGSANALRELLLGQWRWGFLSRLHNDNPRSEVKIEMRLVPVTVQTDADGRVTKVTGDKPVNPDENGNTVFQDGDCVMLELRNSTDTDAYVSVLDLSSDGSISPVLPNPDAPGVVDNRVPGDGEWHRVTGTPDSPFVMRLGSPFGSELFKAIATREKADFSPLLSAPAVAQRGEHTVLQTLKPALNPLGELLLAGVTGRRGSRFAGVPPTNWATADVAFQVKAR